MLKIRRQYTNPYDKDPGITPSKDNSSTVNTSSDSFCAEKEKPGSRNPGLDVAEAATSDDVVITTLPSSAFTDNANNYLASEERVSYKAGYIKIMREASKLLEADPHAFMIMAYIAFNTEREDTKVQPFTKKGECFIGGHSAVRLSAEVYKKALSRLEIIHKAICKCRTIRGTNQGIIVKIVNTDIYDLNINDQERTVERTENEPRTNGHIYTERTKNKEKKKSGRRNAAPVDNAEALRLCSLFIKMLLREIPLLNIPENLNSWHLEFDRLLRIDGIKPPQVELVIAKMPGHFYTKNIQSAEKFRKKFPVLMAYAEEKNASGDVSVNRDFVRQAKKQYAERLKHWSLSGDFLVHAHNSKELSLKMKPEAFKNAFLDMVRSS